MAVTREATKEATKNLAREAEVIACAYHRAARGDLWGALVAAITDALVDLDAAERRIARQDQLISRGYARGWTGAAAGRPGSGAALASCPHPLPDEPASAAAESAHG
ncbi:hypothetical protein MKK75_25045 [Methylobacterium sp. J-030]|uniref:hypothetical protein n=1 Tax=Methylobacterium sp. J-030 TaxID=2836627 RepID=UPI001FBB0359|nr:hypothetical protein [Methylobacterium sp. J-030]MCJ2072029.1 hypothetical protein [Methylobacterium sp. J-030]